MRRHDLTLQINLRCSAAKCRKGNIAIFHHKNECLYGGSQRIDARRQIIIAKASKDDANFLQSFCSHNNFQINKST